MVYSRASLMKGRFSGKMMKPLSQSMVASSSYISPSPLVSSPRIWVNGTPSWVDTGSSPGRCRKMSQVKLSLTMLLAPRK